MKRMQEKCRIGLWPALLASAAGIWAAQPLHAQAGGRLAFEVASIRPTTVRDGEISFDAANGRVTVRNFSVWNLIRSAYHVRDLQISGGPAWVKEKVSIYRPTPRRRECL